MSRNLLDPSNSLSEKVLEKDEIKASLTGTPSLIGNLRHFLNKGDCSRFRSFLEAIIDIQNTSQPQPKQEKRSSFKLPFQSKKQKEPEVTKLKIKDEDETRSLLYELALKHIGYLGTEAEGASNKKTLISLISDCNLLMPGQVEEISKMVDKVKKLHIDLQLATSIKQGSVSYDEQKRSYIIRDGAQILGEIQYDQHNNLVAIESNGELSPINSSLLDEFLQELKKIIRQPGRHQVRAVGKVDDFKDNPFLDVAGIAQVETVDMKWLQLENDFKTLVNEWFSSDKYYNFAKTAKSREFLFFTKDRGQYKIVFLNEVQDFNLYRIEEERFAAVSKGKVEMREGGVSDIKSDKDGMLIMTEEQKRVFASEINKLATSKQQPASHLPARTVPDDGYGSNPNSVQASKDSVVERVDGAGPDLTAIRKLKPKPNTSPQDPETDSHSQSTGWHHKV